MLSICSRLVSTYFAVSAKNMLTCLSACLLQRTMTYSFFRCRYVILELKRSIGLLTVGIVLREHLRFANYNKVFVFK